LTNDVSNKTSHLVLLRYPCNYSTLQFLRYPFSYATIVHTPLKRSHLTGGNTAADG
jgi:hypothetical protein